MTEEFATAMVARGLRVTLGQHCVLAGLDAQVRAGELTLLAGRNGAGKSTLLASLAGVRTPDHGSITIEGKSLTAMRPRQRAKVVTLIPQDYEGDFEFTGRELVLMGRYPHVPRFAAYRREDLEVVEQSLQLVDAQAFADRSIRTLSGGERRRLDIARALATDARYLLADEPTTHLDLEHALMVLDLLQRLAHSGRGVLVASHDLNLVAPRADAVLVLHGGQIAAHGSVDVALTDAVLQRVFGVTSTDDRAAWPKAWRL